jgi:hypothetical protein
MTMSQDDPFTVLNEDIHRFIFQHFDSSDVLSASLVSRLWYETLASSRECLNKLIYTIENVYQVKALQRTSRKYEHFKLTPCCLKELKDIFQTFKVKSMRFNELYGMEIDQAEYISLIESFASTVECLILCDVTSKNPSRILKVVDFCRLKKFHCTLNQTALSILLGNNPRLEHLMISANSVRNEDEIRHDSVLLKFLRKNNRITSLCILNLEQIFLHDISSIIKNIKYLTFTTNFLQNSMCENFLKFIEAQETLDKLHVMGCADKKILTQIWNVAKNIKIFTFDCNVQNDSINYELTKKKSIKEIDFCLTSSVIAISFLRVTPKVEYIKVRQLSKQLLVNCIHLKCLKLITFQSIDRDAYEFFIRNTSILNNLKLQELDFFEYLSLNKISSF